MNTTIDNDLELLSKKIYLESPDLWIEFSDKISERIINEMVLFFAIKHNLTSILKFAIDNNSLNLDMPSRNNNYSSIKEHLIAASKQYNCKEAFNLLTNNENVSIDSLNTKTTNTSKYITENIGEKTTENLPKFICQNCKSNIFDLGYRVVSNSVHKFSSSENKLVKTHSEEPQQVVCNNCNTTLANATACKLEQLCEIQSCNSCGKDLTEIGIYDKSKLVYDNDVNKFVSKSTSYHCCNCNSQLTENQKKYFDL